MKPKRMTGDPLVKYHKVFENLEEERLIVASHLVELCGHHHFDITEDGHILYDELIVVGFIGEDSLELVYYANGLDYYGVYGTLEKIFKNAVSYNTQGILKF